MAPVLGVFCVESRVRHKLYGFLVTRLDVRRRERLVRGAAWVVHGEANSETPVEASTEVAGMRLGREATGRHACAPLESVVRIVWPPQKKQKVRGRRCACLHIITMLRCVYVELFAFSYMYMLAYVSFWILFCMNILFASFRA